MTKKHWNKERRAGHQAAPSNEWIACDGPTARGLLPGNMVPTGMAPLADVLAQFPGAGQTDPSCPDGTRDADVMLAALAALIQLLRTVPVVPAVAPKRRVKVSARRIEETVRLIQQCGLAPTGIVHRPDGSTAIEIGNPPTITPLKATGWDWDAIEARQR